MWHYQLMKKKNDKEYIDKGLVGEYSYSIHEYYPNIGENKKAAYTVNPSTLEGESIEDVKNQLLFMLADLEKYGVKDYGDS